MALETEYKGVRIIIWARQITAKRWTWEFSAGDWPSRRNDDSSLSSQQAAEDEALCEAKRLIDAG